MVERIQRWAAGRPDVVGLLLVGSYARGAARPDSDVDLVLLTTEETAYVNRAWPRDLDFDTPLRVRSWGVLTEYRFVTESGLEAEINIGPPHWAEVHPVDPGTRRVVRDGARILYDPQNLLAALFRACGSAERG